MVEKLPTLTLTEVRNLPKLSLPCIHRTRLSALPGQPPLRRLSDVSEIGPEVCARSRPATGARPTRKLNFRTPAEVLTGSRTHQTPSRRLQRCQNYCQLLGPKGTHLDRRLEVISVPISIRLPANSPPTARLEQKLLDAGRSRVKKTLKWRTLRNKQESETTIRKVERPRKG